MEQGKGLTLTIQSIVSIAVILSMLLACVQWFLKLDARNEQLASMVILMQGKIAKNEAKIDRGILPLAVERIEVMKRQHMDLELRLEAWIGEHNKLFVPATHLQEDIDELKKDVKKLQETKYAER
jgi:hypothetical protein